MKKLFVFFWLCFALFSFAQNKTITSSEIRWKGYKTLKAESLSHFGTIKLKSGNFLFKNNEIAGGTFTMDMMTMDAEDLNNDKKMKKMTIHCKLQALHWGVAAIHDQTCSVNR